MSDEPRPCKLCGQVRALCRSHIVPELAYQPIKNTKGQIYSVGRKTKKVQTGYYEKLLCQDCETLLSRYENSFKKAWMDSIPPDFRHLRTRQDRDVISVDIPDYAAFKLFHLSVLWRAAVSTGFKVDPRISLAPHDDEIAKMITEGKAGEPGDFAFFATLNLDQRCRPVPVVHQLAEGEGTIESYPYYMMSYAYCDWVFVIGRPGPQWLRDLETMYRERNIFLLLPVPHTESKSFKLGVEVLRRLRQ